MLHGKKMSHLGFRNSQLYDASGNLKDEINCATDWFMGNNITKQTMQRKDPFSFGNSQDNWQTSQDSGGTPRF